MNFSKMGLKTKMLVAYGMPMVFVIILAVVFTFRIQSAIEAYQPEKAAQEEQQPSGSESEIGKNVMDELQMMVAGMIIIFVAALIALFLMGGRFISSVRQIIRGLTESSGQIGYVSGQLSSGSQQFAERSSEQASSVEETASSLEEMSSMTKQNADNANQADHLMNDSKQIVKTANESMTELTVSMEDISKASKETSKIIKTIDEIAFQTNLLALNAAVEAARAGEAGAGFAVVADEVRNLAMRAAEAARNTSQLIEGTVKRIQEGSDLVSKTNEHFLSVATSTTQVGELVSEIAGTSNEQAQGIEQISTAVAEMDKIIQQNAANAEESASASEEMNSRVEQMEVYVEELTSLFGGWDGQEADDDMIVTPQPYRSEELKRPDIYVPVKKKPEPAEMAPLKKKEIRPEQIIPMDDDDFEDF